MLTGHPLSHCPSPCPSLPMLFGYAFQQAGCERDGLQQPHQLLATLRHGGLVASRQLHKLSAAICRSCSSTCSSASCNSSDSSPAARALAPGAAIFVPAPARRAANGSNSIQRSDNEPFNMRILLLFGPVIVLDSSFHLCRVQ